jgi:hypothetical protein
MVEELAKEKPDGSPSAALSEVIDALLEASVQALGAPESSSLAVDWTDLESFSRPPHKRRADPEGAEGLSEHDAEQDAQERDGHCADPEASWGHRHDDAPGQKDEAFFGYYLQAATIVSRDERRAPERHGGLVDHDLDDFDAVQRLRPPRYLDRLELARRGRAGGTEAVGREHVDDLAIEVEAKAALSLGCLTFTEGCAEGLEASGGPCRPTRTRSGVRENVDVGRRPLGLLRLDGKESNHESPDETPATISAEGRGDLCHCAPQLQSRLDRSGRCEWTRQAHCRRCATPSRGPPVAVDAGDELSADACRTRVDVRAEIDGDRREGSESSATQEPRTIGDRAQDDVRLGSGHWLQRVFASQRRDMTRGYVGVDGVGAYETEVVRGGSRRTAEHQIGSIAQGSQLAGKRPIRGGLGASSEARAQSAQTVDLERPANPPARRWLKLGRQLLAGCREQQRPRVDRRERTPRRSLLTIAARDAGAIDQPDAADLLGREGAGRDQRPYPRRMHAQLIGSGGDRQQIKHALFIASIICFCYWRFLR